ncbi:MAG: hypothetical protein R3195_06575 [Gemmatimonadota bacterium]|nr:hypothetical protein [Gemmatimonadota bacterium]
MQGPPGHELHGVTGAHLYEDGSLVVANGGSYELRFFDGTGGFLHSSGGSGDGPGEYRQIVLLRSFARDSLFVYDGRQARATILSHDGRLARSFGMPPAAGFVVVEDVFPDGRSVASVVTGFRSDQTHTGVHRPNVRLVELDREGTVVRDLGEFPGDESYALAESGSMIVGPLAFGASLHVAVVGNDGIAIGATDEEHLRIHTAGAGEEAPHGLARRATTERDFQRAMNAYLDDFAPDARLIEARRFDDMPRVEARPYFDELRGDPAGNVWVRHYSGPEDPTRLWTVFDGSGAVVATARTPDDVEVLEIGRDHVVVLSRDVLDVERVEVLSLRRQGCAVSQRADGG